MFLPTPRLQYVSDNGINLVRLPLMLMISCLAAVSCGWLMFFALAINLYLVVLVPCLVSVLLGSLLYYMLSWVKCRNVLLGITLGLSFGSISYVSSFAFDMLNRLPEPDCYHLELLPLYIHARLASDTISDTPQAQQGRQELDVEVPPSPYWFNLLVSLAELAACMAIPAIQCFEASRRVFDRQSNRWLNTLNTCLPAFSSLPILETLGTTRFPIVAVELQNIMESLMAEYRQSNKLSPVAQLTLHYAKFSSTPLEHPTYLTIADYQDKPDQQFSVRDIQYKQLLLTPDELLAIRPWFPTFARQLARCYSSLPPVVDLSHCDEPAQAFYFPAIDPPVLSNSHAATPNC